MHALDRIVAVLSDGYWHDVIDLVDKVDLNEVKLGIALAFLKEYGFIRLSKDSAKLTDEMLKFQREIKELDN